MERMGHSTINVTLGTYGHLFPAIGAQLDDALARRFEGAGSNRGGAAISRLQRQH